MSNADEGEIARGVCPGVETLQALAECELEEAAAELVCHHAGCCDHCASILTAIRRQRAWCMEMLATEVEAGAESDRQVLARVRSRLSSLDPPATARRTEGAAAASNGSSSCGAARLQTANGDAPAATSLPRARAKPGRPRRPGFGVWRIAALVSVPLGSVIAAGLLFPDHVGASADRILEETILRERAWAAEPGVTLHWVVESDVRSRPSWPDGRHRFDIWQQNLADGRSTRLSYHYDPAGSLTAATWQRTDGSTVTWLAGDGGQIHVAPPFRVLEAALPDLPPQLQDSLRAHLRARERSILPRLQNRGMAEYLRRSTDPAATNARVDRVRSAGDQDLYRVRTSRSFPSGHALRRLEQEDFIGTHDFRRYRMLARRFFRDGTVETEDMQWAYFESVRVGSLPTALIEELSAKASAVVTLTPLDVALDALRSQQAQEGTRLSPAATVALRPGSRAALIVQWRVEDGYYLNDQQPSTIAFRFAGGIVVAPGSIQTSGRVTGVAEQAVEIAAAADARSGQHIVDANATIYFCSISGGWCKQSRRALAIQVDVDPRAPEPPAQAEMPILVPLGEER
ncbi:MAG: hypothetical protein ACE148_17015 [Vicinamibacterales bacterium]